MLPLFDMLALTRSVERKRECRYAGIYLEQLQPLLEVLEKEVLEVNVILLELQE